MASLQKEQALRMSDVREHGEGFDVELTVTPETDGRICIRARNEGGNNDTLVDLYDVIEWLQRGPIEGRIAAGFRLPLDGC